MQNDEMEFYEGTISWFVHFLLELGPKRVYDDANKVLEEEVMHRLEEKSWTASDLSRYINETISIEAEPCLPVVSRQRM